MINEPLKIKPHHAERAQRFLAFGKPSDRGMLDYLEQAMKSDPNIEVEFIKGIDPFCQLCIDGGTGSKSCAMSADIVEIDECVAREHGWEFGKLYKVKDLLEELRAEAPKRKIFYICRLERDELRQWLSDIRESKSK